jgi:hypothetical protein
MHPSGVMFFEQLHLLNIYAIRHDETSVLVKSESVSFLPRTILVEFPDEIIEDREHQNKASNKKTTEKVLFHMDIQLCVIDDDDGKKIKMRTNAKVEVRESDFPQLFAINLYGKDIISFSLMSLILLF